MNQRGTSTVETAPWKYEGWIAAKDIVTAGMLACCLIAALLPARYWRAASRLMARAHLRLRSGSAHLLEQPGAFLNKDPRSLVQEAVAADYLFNIQATREILPGEWRCEIPLTGREVLDGALQRSRGAVLWYSPFVGSEFVPKKALALAGYRLTLLSSPFHPFSSSRIGGRLLNPVRLCAENRYLTRRVRVVYGNAQPALAVLRQVLLENGVVLIKAIGTGRRSLTFPFLGGIIDLAVGAPRLAYETGAALISVHTLPDHNGEYRVELGPELTPPTGLSDHQAVHHMASRYVDLLEPIVLAYPAHWEGWFHPDTWRPIS